MSNLGDLSVIIGNKNTGKTIFARNIAKKLSINYYYFDYNTINFAELQDFYNRNKYNNIVIVFDNYFRMNRFSEKDSLFRKNKNFTLIYVMTYVDTIMIRNANSIYYGKEDNFENIKYFHSFISKYFNNYCSLDWITNAMDDLNDYGFICFDKELRNKKKNIYLKI